MITLTPIQCPICKGDLVAERLACYNCGTSLEGVFYLHPLLRLTPEQLQFVALFLRCEGKLNALQEELGISYPTVRNRLREIVQALGYEVGEDAGESRQALLDDVAQGRATVEQALKTLHKHG